MINFLLGCALLVLCLYIGAFVLQLLLVAVIAVFALVGAGCSWIWSKLKGE